MNLNPGHPIRSVGLPRFADSKHIWCDTCGARSKGHTHKGHALCKAVNFYDSTSHRMRVLVSSEVLAYIAFSVHLRLRLDSQEAIATATPFQVFLHLPPAAEDLKTTNFA